ncbi:MAG: hypothetical protein PHV51_07370 [Methanosarcinaceae archaeon]|nr:hypothetical protein [Methanosarcinaceae archaeon]MDD4497950.1 hypothetical protein [Methanosarcinaceae archaeon]
MSRGRGKSRSGSFGNYSNRVRQPIFQSASGGRISLLKVILLAVVLYFLLRLIVPLVWVLVVIAILLMGLKYILKWF